MGLDLTPRDYLKMLTDEYQEYKEHWHANQYRVSTRKAINCCGLSNALPEIITAHKNPTDTPKELKKKSSAYRRYLRDHQCKAHHTVRDICDLSKHAKLTLRYGVDKPTVQDATRITRQEGIARLPLMFPESRDVERLWIRHEDGREELMDDVLEQVIASWNAIFEQDKL